MPSIRVATFSIVAHDPGGPAWGIAVASKFPAVGAVVPWARAGAGALATQSYANTSYGPAGLERMGQGLSAEQTLQELIAGDEERALRQVGLVDASGSAASYTGDDCFEWAGGRTGTNYAVQGNILAGPGVVDAMAGAYENSSGELPGRLLAALLAGDQAGGDRRGKQSAAIYVVKPDAGYGGFNDRWIDYRVDDHPDPVPALRDLVELHGLYFGESEPGDQVPIEADVARGLQEIMHRLGYLSVPPSGKYDAATAAALRAFVGNENFEERTDVEAGVIDRPVLDYLLGKFGS